MAMLFALRNFLSPTHTWNLFDFNNNFMGKWHEVKSKHMACTGVLVLELKAFHQESLAVRSIDLKSNT